MSACTLPSYVLDNPTVSTAGDSAISAAIVLATRSGIARAVFGETGSRSFAATPAVFTELLPKPRHRMLSYMAVEPSHERGARHEGGEHGGRRSDPARGEGAARAGALRDPADHCRAGRDARESAGMPARAGSSADRGRSWAREDSDRQDDRRRARRLLRAGAVHARPRPVGSRRYSDLPGRRRHVRHGARPGVLQLPHGGRDQPCSGQGPVGSARRDAGASGHDRPRHAPSPRSVPRHGDAEPDRVRRDVPTARGTDRQVHAEGPDRVPATRRGAHGRAASARGRARASAGSLARRPEGTTARRVRDLRRSVARELCRRHCDSHPRARPATRPGARERRVRSASALLSRPTPARPGPGPMAEGLLRALDISIGRRVEGLLAGDFRSNLLGTGSELAMVRPYAPGDDVRRIDWNVTARTGEPHVRVHLPERVLVTWLALDVSASMEFGTADRRKADVAEG